MFHRLLLLGATLLAVLLVPMRALAVTPPYFEDFESEATCSGTCSAACVLGPSGWLNEPTLDGADWTVDVGGTSSGLTGPSVDHNPGTSGGKYLYLETTSPCFTIEAHLISPVLDLTGTTNPVVEFWYHMYGQSQGTLHVDILDASMNVLQLDAIPAESGDHGDVWLESATVNLVPYIAMGQVYVRIRGIGGGNFYSDMAVDDFGFFEILPDDVGVSEIFSPSLGGCVGSQTVSVELTNFGINPQSNFPVQYEIDGGAPVVETFTGTLNALSSVMFTFATPASFGLGGHTINATTGLAGDQVAANDGVSGGFSAAPIVASYPSLESFDGQLAWDATGTSSSWQLGTPAGTTIVGATSGANAWITGLATGYNDNESSDVRTLCGYDMSALTSPAIRFNVAWDSSFSNDGAAIQSSIDGGQSWQTIGVNGDPNNWYNDSTIIGNPGGQQLGWTGTGTNSSNGWVSAFHDVPTLAGQSSVLFRVAFGSNPTTVSGDGFAFDDFEIIDNVDNVGVISIDAPASGCGLGMETVTVTLENIGGNAVSNFPVEYVYDGGTPVVESFTGTIPPFSAAQFSFATALTVGGIGQHLLTVSTNYASDNDPLNDTMTTMLLNGQIVASFPSLEDFETQPFWEASGTNSTWELGTPAGATIIGAASGSNAWMTGLSSAYNNGESSQVTSVCGYDMSTLTSPAIRVNVAWDSSFSNDGAAIQSSIDGGQTWQTIGTNGDPNNWYNDSTIIGNPGGQQLGWTGTGTNSSNGWVSAFHDVPTLAGQSSVLFRVAFGSNPTTVSGDGFAFDDIEIFDNAARLDIWDAGPVAPIAPLAAASTDVLVHVLDMQPFGSVGHFVTSMTMQQVGTLTDADFAAVNLWEDDGDGAFDPALDILVDSQNWAGGALTFDTTTPPLVVPLFSTKRVFVSVDLNANATPSGTFATSIAMESDVTSNTPAPIAFVNPPILGPTFAVEGTVSTLPFSDLLNGASGNRTVSLASGLSYPTATMAGPNVGSSAATGNDAEVAVVSSVSVNDGMGGFIPVVPTSDPGMLAISFPNGAATGAVDYAFDLSAYSVATDKVFLLYGWNNANEEDHDEDNVFISVDGGTTWSASLYRFVFSTPVPPSWSGAAIDVSAALEAAGADFSTDVVLRFQAAGDQPLGDDGLLLDDVWLGLAPTLSVERPEMTVLASGASDAVGTVMAGAETLTYTVRNNGHLALALDPASFASANESNVANVSVGQPLSTDLQPGETTTFDVSFDANDPGTFSFDITFTSNDPALALGSYQLTVSGDVDGGGAGGAGAGGAGVATGGGGDGTTPPPVDDGGCGCDVPGSRGSAPPAGWLALALLGLGVVRRRRRRDASFLQRTFLQRTVLATLATAVVGAGMAGGCAAGSEPQNTTDLATSSTTDGVGGSATSSSGAGGSAGNGGAGGNTGDCPIDCSTISTPDCQLSVCNDGSHSGPVGQCVIIDEADGTTCDDAMFCTVNDTCVSGACNGGVPNDCGMMATPCEEVICDETAQACTLNALTDGTTCNNGDLCVTGETCSFGSCVGGVPKDCFFTPVPNECHVGVCNPLNGVCEATPGNEFQPCVDPNDLCTDNKTCAGGVCFGGAPKDCSGLTMGCDLGVCDTTSGQCTTTPVMNGQTCNDLDACTSGEVCTNGNCGGGTLTTVCELNGDGCCPASCTPTNDLDCACGLNKIRIHEVYIGTVDYIIVDNPTTCALDLDPLEIVFDDSSSTDVFYNVPSFVLAANSQVLITESSSPPAGALSTGTNILFSGTRGGLVLICDGACNYSNGSNVVDAFPWEGAALPPPMPTGITFTPTHATGITSTNEATTSHLRVANTGANPNFFLADWTTGPNTN